MPSGRPGIGRAARSVMLTRVKRRVNVEGVPRLPAFSHAVQVDDHIYVAGEPGHMVTGSRWYRRLIRETR